MKRTPLRRRERVRPVNFERIAKLRAEQFGTDGYREEILATPCIVTGWLPVDPCHVIGTRGAGHGPEGLAPLRRDVHIDFDGSMTDERFFARWKVSRADIRAWAVARRERWAERDEELAS